MKKHEHAGLRPAAHVKVHVQEFARDSALATGKSFKRALKVLVPLPILESSSFFGGLNRLGDAMVNAGTESKDAQEKSKQYVIRHSGGAVADAAIGIALFGIPITLVTSLFSDGCKVISAVLKDADDGHEETVKAGEFFGDLSKVSNNFMRLFDIPSRETAAEVHGSIQYLSERLNEEGKLTTSMKRDLKELDQLCACEVKDATEWFARVQEQLSKIANEELRESKVCCDVPEVQKFVERPTVGNIKDMRDGLIKDLNRKNIPIKRNTKNLVDSLVTSLESFSTDEFQDQMRTLMIKQYEIADKAQDTIEHAAYHGYKFVHSILNLSYKGALLFGRHYKRQIECAVDKEKCEL